MSNDCLHFQHQWLVIFLYYTYQEQWYIYVNSQNRNIHVINCTCCQSIYSETLHNPDPIILSCINFYSPNFHHSSCNDF